jgi:Reeler domain
MKSRFLFFLFFGALAFITLTANKNGRASSQNRGNTGAPGDETNINGTPKTCMACHNSGPITASLTIRLLDSMNQVVTQYKPDYQYKAVVQIKGSNNPAGYGFQMIALKDAGNVDLKGFKDVNPNNYKLANISNGRTYAEHDNISTPDSFAVTWKAPVAGTGTVTFYASGNAVDKNGSTSGDGAAAASLKISEIGATAENTPASSPVLFKLNPNPVYASANLSIALKEGGEYYFQGFAATGALIWEQTMTLSAGENRFPVTTSEWPAGLYYIAVSHEQQRIGSVKLLKL